VSKNVRRLQPEHGLQANAACMRSFPGIRKLLRRKQNGSDEPHVTTLKTPVILALQLFRLRKCRNMAPSVCSPHSLAIVTHEYHQPAYWKKSYAMTHAVVDASMVSDVCSDQHQKWVFSAVLLPLPCLLQMRCVIIAIFLCRWFVKMFTAGRQGVAKY
jgi:hypothetical protein